MVEVYKGHNLSDKSEAYNLLKARKFKELDAHLEEVAKKALKLQGDPTEAIARQRHLMRERGFIITET